MRLSPGGAGGVESFLACGSTFNSSNGDGFQSEFPEVIEVQDLHEDPELDRWLTAVSFAACTLTGNGIDLKAHMRIDEDEEGHVDTVADNLVYLSSTTYNNRKKLNPEESFIWDERQ